MAKFLFTQSELESVKQAVMAAERKTSSEIVPVLLQKSDSYPQAVWKGGVSAAVLVSLLVILLDRLYVSNYGIVDPVYLFGTSLYCGLVFAIAVHYTPSLKRFIAGSNQLYAKTLAMAEKVFLEEEVFRTKERTGILIFLSHLERQVHILGDTCINDKVTQEEWDAVALAIVQGIQTGKPASGLIKGIELCGDLLEKNGVDLQPDDTDELSNELRLK